MKTLNILMGFLFILGYKMMAASFTIGIVPIDGGKPIATNTNPEKRGNSGLEQVLQLITDLQKMKEMLRLKE